MRNMCIHKLLTVDWEETVRPCQSNEDHREEHLDTVAKRYKQVVLSTEKSEQQYFKFYSLTKRKLANVALKARLTTYMFDPDQIFPKASHLRNYISADQL